MTLWTPDGEHPVDPDEGARHPGDDDFDPEDLSPEDRARLEEIATEMAEIREQLRSVPASQVVANHAMGLYELAAIHLSHDPPDLEEARVAIDAMAGMLDGAKGRLGEAEPTLQDALAQLRLAFVQLRGSQG